LAEEAKVAEMRHAWSQRRFGANEEDFWGHP
jgi:hypothetical protein